MHKEAVAGPREIVTVLYNPGHRLFQLAFTADMTSAPIMNLWDLLRKHRIQIVSSTLFNLHGKVGTWSVVLDSDDYGVTRQGLTRILGELDFLGDLRVTGGNDLIIEDQYFPLLDSTGNRVMLITQESLQRMLTAMGELFGTGGTLISYQEGMALGSKATGRLRAAVKGDLRVFLREAVKLYGAMGIGRCDFVEANLDTLHFVARMHHNIECEGKQADKPNSQWVRGHLCGAATTALQVQMQCNETKCAAMGDPWCEFVFDKQAV